MSQPDWTRLSGSVDRQYRRDRPRSEIRVNSAQAPESAGKPREVSRHQIALKPASTPAVHSSEGHSGAARIAELRARLADTTARLEKGYTIMGGFDCPNITDPQRIENLTATWERLNSEATELAREYFALTGETWRPAHGYAI